MIGSFISGQIFLTGTWNTLLELCTWYRCILPNWVSWLSQGTLLVWGGSAPATRVLIHLWWSCIGMVWGLRVPLVMALLHVGLVWSRLLISSTFEWGVFYYWFLCNHIIMRVWTLHVCEVIASWLWVVWLLNFEPSGFILVSFTPHATFVGISVFGDYLTWTILQSLVSLLVC